MSEDAKKKRGNTQVNTRVSDELVARLDRVVAAMATDIIPGTPTPDRGMALRAALIAGLPLLEARLGIAADEPPTKVKKGTTKTPRKA
jgi:hypothetical protein